MKTAPALEGEEKQNAWAGEGRVLPSYSSYFRHQGTGCSLLWYFQMVKFYQKVIYRTSSKPFTFVCLFSLFKPVQIAGYVTVELACFEKGLICTLSRSQKCVCNICYFLHKFCTSSLITFSMHAGIKPA